MISFQFKCKFFNVIISFLLKGGEKNNILSGSCNCSNNQKFNQKKG